MQSNRQANARTATKGSKHPHAAAVQAQSCSDLAAASAASREAAEGEDSLQQTTRNMIKRRTLWNALLAAGQQLWDLLPAEQQVQHLNPEASSSEEDVPADSALHTLAAAAEQCADLEMTAAASAASEKPPSKKRQRGDDEDQTVEPTNKQGRLIIKDVNKQ